MQGQVSTELGDRSGTHGVDGFLRCVLHIPIVINVPVEKVREVCEGAIYPIVMAILNTSRQPSKPQQIVRQAHFHAYSTWMRPIFFRNVKLPDDGYTASSAFCWLKELYSIETLYSVKRSLRV